MHHFESFVEIKLLLNLTLEKKKNNKNKLAKKKKIFLKILKKEKYFKYEIFIKYAQRKCLNNKKNTLVFLKSDSI